MSRGCKPDSLSISQRSEKVKNRAVIYARYSSHAQNDASIEQQEAKCLEFASRLGVTVLRTYADRAISGKSDRRPEFQRMLKDAERHEFDIVIAWKSNRIGRNMVEALVNDAKLLQNDVETRYVEEDFDDSAAGRFALRSMMNLNQFYSENMAEDIRRGLDDAARKGSAIGSMPMGYRRDPATGSFIIDEQEAALVREIFRRYASGETVASIIDDLNARHIRTRYGNAFHKNSFSTLLKNRKYIGEFQWGDITVPNAIPPIIDPDTFERAQSRSRFHGSVTGRRRTDVKYLLTGFLYCGHCLEPMSGYSGTGKAGKTYHYYVCNGHKLHNCQKKNVPKDYIETFIARYLCEHVLTDEVISWIADQVLTLQDKFKQDSQLAYYEDRLKENHTAMTNLLTAIERGLSGSTVNARMEELESEEADLTALIDREKSLQPTLTRDMILFYFSRFRTGDLTDPRVQEQLFKTFLSKVYLYDDRVRIGFNSVTGGNFSEDFSCDLEFNPDCSFKDSESPLDHAETNTMVFTFTPTVIWVEARLP